MTNKTSWTLLTPPSQGPIAIVQLHKNVTPILETLTGRSNWEENKLYLVNIPDIDEVVAVKIKPDLAHIMPHGSIHILRKLETRFTELNIDHTNNFQYPEAQDNIEAAMLFALSKAQSPLAVRLLLEQPPKLRGATASSEDAARSTILNHLITPPKVVLLGSPNTGKSTLMNALTKQDTSIVHELPGATRDAVGARINCGGLVIDLYDLPGFRESNDPIEQKAIALAQAIADESTLTLLIADCEHDWLETTGDSIRIGTKSDIHIRRDADICVSAHNGERMEELSVFIRDAIIPPQIMSNDSPWFFDGYYPIAE